MAEELFKFRINNCADLKSGVSGLMRVKNDGEFIESCVRSCLPALDELIIVYNDCSDNSVDEIQKCAAKYPDKIRVFEYKVAVLANNLTWEEYHEALALPADSPRLLCNYYNYALSKARYTHAIKIDADQIYITETLQRWCDVARAGTVKKKAFNYQLGKIVFNYFRLMRKLSITLRNRLPFTGIKLGRYLRDAYLHYAKVGFSEGTHTISLSGLNVYKTKEENFFVPLGMKCSPMNILPPFNGENDHLLFRISEKTYYKPVISEYYNLQRTSKFSLIEEMVHPYIPINVGFCWYHLNACRKSYSEKANIIFSEHPDKYMKLQDFLNSSFNTIERKSDKIMFTLYQRILFSFLFKNMRSDFSHI